MPPRIHGALLLLLACATARPALAADALEHRGVVYVSVAALLDRAFLDGRWELTNQGRTLVARFADRTVRFEEGGSRIARDEQEPVPLRSPVLVLAAGDHYVPAEECAAAFGYAYVPDPTPTLTLSEKQLKLDAQPLRPPHLRTRVDDLRPIRRGVVLTAPLSARRNLHEKTKADTLPADTSLLIRREARLDHSPYAIVTRCDESLESYAVRADELGRGAREASIEHTHLGRVLRRLDELTDLSASVNHGPRAALPRTVAVTVDMCWSLRPYEKDFFALVERLGSNQGPVGITLFMTRWVEQHPEEMERLIELSEQPGVSVTWGLHSWVHPKERPFMNGYPPREVKDDALRVERELLQWGIVPSVFYRFPGLVHDGERLRAIRELDLISVDCESWMASMRIRRPPHRLPPRDGSILLVHGNGNEPLGISRLSEWMTENAGWRWAPLNQFISADDAEDIIPATAPAAHPN